MIDYMQFLSGSDVRGIAAEGVVGEEINLTDEVCENIAAAFVHWLSKTLNKNIYELKIAVGHDSRISANRLLNTVSQGINHTGANVMICGLASTPAMFMSTLKHADGSIQLTASHHPFNRNGLKFFTKEGGLNSKDVKEILENASKKPETLDYMSEYKTFLTDLVKKEVNDFEKPLNGFHIVVDAGNGAGGFYASVLQELGADISGSLFLEPDGMFPNHIPNPEDKKAMSFITKATLESKADLGVIFDTDVDRAGCVLSDGSSLNKNRLIALASVLALEKYPHGTIVTDSITSDALKIFIENLGGKHLRFKRGYKNVINEALRLNENGETAPLAIETSGHAAFMDNYFLDDGAFLVTKVIIKMAQLKKEGKSLNELLNGFNEALETAEIRFKLTGEDFVKDGQNILENLKKFVESESDFVPEEINHEGYRVNSKAADGWFLLRMSVHDPVMPLNIESNKKGGVMEIAKRIAVFMQKENVIDISKLIEFID